MPGGGVTLACADPPAAPLIDPGLLRDERDNDRMVAGLRLLREAAAASALAPFAGAEVTYSVDDARQIVTLTDVTWTG